MQTTMTIVAPEGSVLDSNLSSRLNDTLLRMQVAFVLEDASNHNAAVLKLIDTTDAEQRLVVRLLQRAGYNIELDIG